MRELRFRIRDEKNNEWIYCGIFDLGKYKDLIDKGRGYRFTGFRDANGSTIWEGSMVKWQLGENSGKVFFKEGEFIIIDLVSKYEWRLKSALNYGLEVTL